MENETTEIEIIDNSAALMALNKSEIDVQIATAKRWPRSIKKFQDGLLEMATLDQETAEACWYVLPRKNEKGEYIQGESVRFAELALHAWGNARAASRITEVGERHVTAQSTAIDLETNIAVCIEKRGRITKKNGDRYGDDMINNTCNGTASKAFRDAVFKIIPKSLRKKAIDAARKVAVGDSATLADRRAKAIDQFVQKGVAKEAIFRKLGRAGIEDVTLSDLEFLTGIRTAVKEGEIKLSEAFVVDENNDDSSTTPAAADLNAKLAARKEELKRQAAAVQKPAATDTEGRPLGDLPPFELEEPTTKHGS